jgi:hypothetical protein
MRLCVIIHSPLQLLLIMTLQSRDMTMRKSLLDHPHLSKLLRSCPIAHFPMDQFPSHAESALHKEKELTIE